MPVLLVGGAGLGVLAGSETEACVVQARQSPAVVEAEDGLGQQVQHAVEDHLSGRSDDVASVSNAPGDCRYERNQEQFINEHSSHNVLGYPNQRNERTAAEAVNSLR